MGGLNVLTFRPACGNWQPPRRYGGGPLRNVAVSRKLGLERYSSCSGWFAPYADAQAGPALHQGGIGPSRARAKTTYNSQVARDRQNV